MRRSLGREQARVTRNAIRRHTQDVAELTREASSPDALVEVGGMDDGGEWVSYGLLDITPLDSFRLR